MKVLLVNTSESNGGAAIAASRILEALRDEGIDVTMMVCSPESHGEAVVSVGGRLQKQWCFIWERFVIWINNRLSRKNLFKVSIADTGIDITKTKEFKQADIINLHWVNQGMLSLRGIGKILRSGKQVVWTMHDMWPFTGICHYAYDCSGYENACGNCHFLHSPGRRDLSSLVFHRKKKMFSQANNLSFVAVSSWLADRARSSMLIKPFAVHVIPNVLPLDKFSIIDRSKARNDLGIIEPYVISFGAARIDDPIKGFNYLTEALRLLLESGNFKREEIRLLVFGNIRDASILEKVPVPYSNLGYINDPGIMSQIYSASNTTVSSSLYETFGQTMIESMSCGSVPVSFNGSGQADIINHLSNGYLAERMSAKSLAEGIAWALRCNISPTELHQSVINRYSGKIVAQQYLSIFK